MLLGTRSLGDEIIEFNVRLRQWQPYCQRYFLKSYLIFHIPFMMQNPFTILLNRSGFQDYYTKAKQSNELTKVPSIFPEILHTVPDTPLSSPFCCIFYTPPI